MDSTKMNLPIVCDLSVFSTEERQHHEMTSMDLMKGAKRIIELEDGFAFHNDYTEAKFIETAKWATRENKCCPFFTFELVIEPFASGREIIVRLKGNIQIKQMLKSGMDKLEIKLND
jgi:hypothetical protein